jgi:intracellular sulfur oxidation DsrE/DsrF family protein
MWTRRRIWGISFLAGMAGSGSVRAAIQSHRNPNAVYQLSELDRVSFALANIRNHYAGVGDEPVQISLVVIGGAVRAFQSASSPLEVAESFRELVENNRLRALACSNSLRAQGIDVAALLSGFRAVDSGVVTIAQLQAQGYAYIRP